MKIAFCSDLHLNCAKDSIKKKLGNKILKSNCDMVVIAGDIAEAPLLEEELTNLLSYYNKPTYFILGNHDYYKSSLFDTKMWASYLNINNLIYLNDRIVKLNSNTCMMGHDGFYDGLNGRFFAKDEFWLWDFSLIEEFKKLSRQEIFNFIKKLGEFWAKDIKRDLEKALETYDNILYFTHVPPFKEASWYNDCPGEEKAIPMFSCKQAGDMMLEIMSGHPNKKLTIYCGHTHNEYRWVSNNIEVIVSKARYSNPSIYKYIEI